MATNLNVSRASVTVTEQLPPGSSGSDKDLAQKPSQDKRISPQGSSSSGKGKSVELPDRNIRSLADASDDLRSAGKAKLSFGRFKNAVLSKLPFVGKTTYGQVMDQARAYHTQAAGLSGSEKHDRLKTLESTIIKWQTRHGNDAGAKADALGEVLKAVRAERRSVEAEGSRAAAPSRDKAMAAVAKEFSNIQGGLNAKTLFRGNTEATRALKQHLHDNVPPSYLREVRELSIDVTRRLDPGDRVDDFAALRKEHGGEVVVEPAKTLGDLSDGALKQVLAAADTIMEHLIGGTNPDDIGAKVEHLPQEVIETLGALDAQVDSASNGDDRARRNAIAGTLFLRFATLALTEGVDSTGQTLSPQDRARRMVSEATMAAINNSPDEFQVTSKMRESHKEDFLAWVRKYDEPMNLFVDAVLERANERAGDGGSSSGSSSGLGRDEGVVRRSQVTEDDGVSFHVGDSSEDEDDPSDPKGKGKID